MIMTPIILSIETKVFNKISLDLSSEERTRSSNPSPRVHSFVFFPSAASLASFLFERLPRSPLVRVRVYDFSSESVPGRVSTRVARLHRRARSLCVDFSPTHSDV